MLHRLATGQRTLMARIAVRIFPDYSREGAPYATNTMAIFLWCLFIKYLFFFSVGLLFLSTLSCLTTWNLIIIKSKWWLTTQAPSKGSYVFTTSFVVLFVNCSSSMLQYDDQNAVENTKKNRRQSPKLVVRIKKVDKLRVYFYSQFDWLLINCGIVRRLDICGHF